MKGTSRESINFIVLLIVFVLFIGFVILYFTGQIDKVTKIISDMVKIKT
ncbi:MAG: hypothetical protein J4428_04480 [Candidatus Aenigmarchaeota archaeon]|nr:hypothetical protein [Candidatus Aenigmarchaeota archaeon]